MRKSVLIHKRWRHLNFWVNPTLHNPLRSEKDSSSNQKPYHARKYKKKKKNITKIRNEVLNIENMNNMNVTWKLQMISILVDLLNNLRRPNFASNKLVIFMDKRMIVSQDSIDKISNNKVHKLTLPVRL